VVTPKSRLTPEVREAILARKPELLALLTRVQVFDGDDPAKKLSAEQTATSTSNAEISTLSSPASIGETARFHQHVSDCPECEQGNWRDGRLCLIGMLLTRQRDLRIRARAPRLRALGPDVP
jgi:hypothetical protein